MATSSAAFRSFRSTGVVVFVNSKTESSSLPTGVKDVRDQGGNTIPIVFVTTADGEKGIDAVSYKDLSANMRKAVRSVKNKIANEDVVGTASASTESKEEANEEKESDDGGLLAESQSWTNAEGKTLTAAVVAVDDTYVHFKKKNGTISKYPIASLSDESQEKVAKLTDR